MNVKFKLHEGMTGMHTLEYRKPLPDMKVYEIKNLIYSRRLGPNVKIFSKDGIFTVSTEYGLTISFLPQNITLAVVVINPRILVEHDHSYIGIFDCSQDKISRIEPEANQVFQLLGLDLRLETFTLSRVDLCLNIYCDDGGMAEFLVRTAQRSPVSDQRYTPCFFPNQKKNAAACNKHSFRIESSHLKFTVYDKTFERSERFHQTPLDKGSLLRIEFALCDEYTVNHYVEPYIESNSGKLNYLAFHSADLLVRHCEKLLGFGFHVPRSLAMEIISQQHLHSKTAERMTDMIDCYNKFHSYKDAEREFLLLCDKHTHNQEENRFLSKMRRRFLQFLLHPVTLPARTYPCLPNITMIVNNVLESKDHCWEVDLNTLKKFLLKYNHITQ